MSCERYAQAIEDHACGAHLAAAAAAHLGSCPGCAAAFEARRGALEALDAELQRAVAIDPSPAFAAGVRAGIGRAPSAGYRLAWLAAPLGIAAALALAVLIGLPGDRPATPAASSNVQPDSPSSISRVLPESPTVAPPATAAVRPAASRGRRPAALPRQPEPEIIVPDDRARALARYMALVRSGEVPATAPMQPPSELQAPSNLVVDPLTVEPMTADRAGTTASTHDHVTQKE